MLNTIQEFLSVKKIPWFRLNNSIIFRVGATKWLIRYSPQHQEYIVFQDEHLVQVVPHVIELIQLIIRGLKVHSNGRFSGSTN